MTPDPAERSASREEVVSVSRESVALLYAACRRMDYADEYTINDLVRDFEQMKQHAISMYHRAGMHLGAPVTGASDEH